jgi:hypothetical protein
MLARCRFCSRHSNPHEFVHDPIIGYCWHCYEWHQRALHMLASGEMPPGCQECNRSKDELLREAGDGDLRMYVHPKDGIYQVLCKRCSDRYERKRLDLYADTPHGFRQKLKGAN